MEFIYCTTFICSILFLALVGNGIFSYFFNRRKKITLNFLENFVISFGLGISFITIYGYLIDFLVTTFTILSEVSFVFIIFTPLIIGISLKIVAMRSTSDEKNIYKMIRTSLNSFRDQLCKKKGNFREYLRNRDNQRQLFHNLIFIAFLIISLGLFFNNILPIMYESDAQFALDAYTWVPVIIYFKNHLVLNYVMRDAYPAGYIILEALLLYFFPFQSYSSQFIYLKWVPFFNFILIICFLYVLLQRLTKNKFYYVLTVFLVLISHYFVYRVIMLLPSPVITIQLEIFILLLLIPGIPKGLLYFFMGSMIILHPLDGAIIIAIYFSFKLMESVVKLFRQKRHGQKIIRVVGDKIGKNIKFYAINLILFILPSGIYIINVLFHESDLLAFYITQGVPLDLFNSFMNIIKVVLTGILNSQSLMQMQNVSEFLSQPEIQWLTQWWFPFTSFSLLCLFIPFRFYKTSRTQMQFVLFLRISMIIGIIFYSLQFLTPILTPYQGNFIIDTILRFLNSFLYLYTKFRVFEILTIINAIYLTFVFEETFRWIWNKGWIVFHPEKIRLYESFLAFVISSFFIAQTIAIPIYREYYCNPAPPSTENFYPNVWAGMYSRNLANFRDLLDQEDAQGATIAYDGNDPNLPVFMWSFFISDYKISAANLSTSPTSIYDRFINNATCGMDFLVISAWYSNTYWNDLQAEFSGKSFLIYQDWGMLILRV